MHSQRLSRQFERTVAQLRDLQKTRQTNETHDLNSLLDILAMHNSTGETYDPALDGFVFSAQQIATAASTRRREHLAEKAYQHRSAAAEWE